MNSVSNIKNSDEIGADIRNKLTPLKNLIALCKEHDKKYYHKILQKKIWIKIMEQLDACDISIEYLTKLL